MFFPEGQVRVHVYGRPVDMRKSFDGLYALTRRELGHDRLNSKVTLVSLLLNVLQIEDVLPLLVTNVQRIDIAFGSFIPLCNKGRIDGTKQLVASFV